MEENARTPTNYNMFASVITCERQKTALQVCLHHMSHIFFGFSSLKTINSALESRVPQTQKLSSEIIAPIFSGDNTHMH